MSPILKHSDVGDEDLVLRYQAQLRGHLESKGQSRLQPPIHNRIGNTSSY